MKMLGLPNRSSLLLALVLVPVLAYLGGRLRILAHGYYNAPGRMPILTNFTSYEVKFQDEIRNCEDTLLLKDRPVALLVCDPGRDTWNTVMGDFSAGVAIEPNAGIYAYSHQQSGEGALKRFELLGFEGELRTIGFEIHEPSATLFVSNHRRAGPQIEQFRLDFEAMTATYLRTIAHPLINSPNSMAAYSADELLVTNQHHFMPAHNRLLWFLETYLAPPLGRVVHVRVLPSGQADAAVVTRQAYPNGITFLGKNESRVAVASTNKSLFYIYKVTNRKNGHPIFELEQTVGNLPYLPDNLATTADGALLIAGHPNLKKLETFRETRRVCHRPENLAKASDAERELCKTTQAGTWVSEWTPEGGISHIYSGWEYPSGCTAVRDRSRGFGIISGLYARGILVWKD